MDQINNNNYIKLFFQWSLIIAVVTAIYYFPFWKNIDAKYNDHWRKEIASSRKPDERIVIIQIDELSLTELEKTSGRWPWSRAEYAYLIDGLIQANVKAIVFDILFSERDVFREDDDKYFRESVAGVNNIFYPAVLLDESQHVQPYPLGVLPENFVVNKSGKATEDSEVAFKFVLPWVLNASDWNIGLINANSDVDGVTRRYNVYVERKGRLFHSLPSRVVEYVETLNGDQKINPKPQTINIKYKGLQSIPFVSYPFSDIRNMVHNGQALEMLTDKIVIIGPTATGLHDLKSTPISQTYPGTSVIAMAIDNLLNDDYLKNIHSQIGLLLVLVLVVVMKVVTGVRDSYQTQLTLSLLLVVLSGVGLYQLSWYLSQKDQLFPAASVFSVLIAYTVSLMFYRGFREFLNRRHTLQTFSRFMDPVVVKQLISDENWQTKLANKTSQVSVLFSDIRGFTSLSEKRSAEQIMTILNDYFDLQVEAIFNNKGTLDKFIGDAIMAFWGAPIEDPNHAINAVETALQMVDNLLEFRETLPEELRGFDVGIGVHSGEAVVGMLGSSRRFDYTAIGDTVNLGSRIEGVTKGIARVLVSESTRELCGNRFKFEFRGEYSVKGREEKVKLYEPERIKE